jgi:hypothetical protein
MVMRISEFMQQAPAFRSGPPQIWPHLAALLARALLWVSRHLQSQQISPGMPSADRDRIFSGFRMKEHDA